MTPDGGEESSGLPRSVPVVTGSDVYNRSVPVGLVLAIGIVAISSAGILVRLLPGVPALAIAAWRLIISAAITVPVAAYRGDLRMPADKDAWRSAAAGAFLTLHFALWITSLKLTTVASSVVLGTTTPLWVSIVSHLFLQERNTAREWLGVAFGILGGVLIGLGDSRMAGSKVAVASGSALLGDALALASAFAISGYFILGRSVRQRLRLLTYTAYVYIVAAVLLTATAGAFRAPLFGYTGRDYALLVCFAVFPQLVGHNSLNWALARLKASVVTLSVLGEAVLSSAAAAVLFHEIPPPLALAGYAFILMGIALASRGYPRGSGTGSDPGSDPVPDPLN